jgi:hypothetical protein
MPWQLSILPGWLRFAKTAGVIAVLFSIDEDARTHIVGWVMPNNPNTAPRVKVTIGKTETIVAAEIYRPLLKSQGLHNTGICGFHISDKQVAGLVEATDLTVVDVDSGLLLYRRRPYPVIAQKLIVVEPSVLPAFSIHKQFAPRFQMPYEMVERHNEETVRAILGIPFSNSVYVGGRIYVREFDYLYRDRGFKAAILLRDPFEELAERLLILKWANERNDPSLGEQIGRDVAAAAKRLKPIDPLSVESLSTALTKLDDDLRNLLFNPLTRQLSTRYPDDRLDPAAVAVSLSALSFFDVVGTRADVPHFIKAVYAALEYEGAADAVALPVSNSIVTLAELLKTVPAAVELARLDYQIYTAVIAARTKVLS